jgi:hypothetical protein
LEPKTRLSPTRLDTGCSAISCARPKQVRQEQQRQHLLRGSVHDGAQVQLEGRWRRQRC